MNSDWEPTVSDKLRSWQVDVNVTVKDHILSDASPGGVLSLFHGTLLCLYSTCPSFFLLL